MRPLILGLCLFCLTATAVRAQLSGISSPAIDSQCYFPIQGEKGVIDTLYGGRNNQFMGLIVKNIGPTVDDPLGKVLVANTGPTRAMMAFSSGPGFNLHNSVAANLPILWDFELQVGRIRTRTSRDIILRYANGWRIYWSADDGSYDSSWYTYITSGRTTDYGEDPTNRLYIAHLSSDTVDDLAYLDFPYWHDGKDTTFLVFFRGGDAMSKKGTAFADSALIIDTGLTNAYFRDFTQGDFRGTGREDLIATDTGNNLLFFANDRPFTMAGLAHALFYDTLLARRESPTMLKLPDSFGANELVMRALPKASWDHSVDFLPVVPTSDARNNGIFIFRGGPDFGKHRITLDSAEFVIRSPHIIDPYNFRTDEGWPERPIDAGDMTGTGNHVIYCTGGDLAGQHYFYVTGNALDEKMDMYFNMIYNGVTYAADTLQANGDRKTDLMIGEPTLQIDQSQKIAGGLALVYGTDKIPVRINPKYSSVPDAGSRSEPGVEIWPNPVHDRAQLHILWPETERLTLSLYDILGHLVLRAATTVQSGEQIITLDMPRLESGVYKLTVTGATKSCASTVTVFH